MWWPRIEKKQTETAITQRQIRNANEEYKGQKTHRGKNEIKKINHIKKKN